MTTTSGTTSDNEGQRVTTNGNEWERVTKIGTSDNEWQWVTTSGTTGGKEWQRVIQRVTTHDSKWQWVRASDSSGTTNENGTVHFKEWIIAIFSITKNKYPISWRDGWLQLEWLDK